MSLQFLCFSSSESRRLMYTNADHLNVLGDMYDCWPDWIMATFNIFLATSSNYGLLRWFAGHDDNYIRINFSHVPL